MTNPAIGSGPAVCAGGGGAIPGGGGTVAGKIVGTFTQLRNAMRTAVAKSASLPTDSASSFQTAAQSLLASVGAALNKIDSSGLNNRDVEKAEANQPACKELSSG